MPAVPLRWNGRIYMRGNGGYAGEQIDAPNRVALRDEALKQGFVAAQTNTGHDAVAQPLGTFARNNMAKLVDYSFRAIHLTTQAAKDLALALYGVKPARAYFDGCSTGGRQGRRSATRTTSTASRPAPRCSISRARCTGWPDRRSAAL